MTAGTWVSAGFVEVDATNLPGIYQFGLPDVVIDATSEGSVVVMLKGATNMAPCVMEIELDGMDYRAGVVPTVTSVTGAVGSVTGAVGSVTGHTAQTGDSFAIVNGASGSVATKTVVDAIPTTAMRGTDSAYTGTPPTAAAVADAVWDELQSAHVTVGSFGIIASEIAAIPTTAMRGTDSAALASVCTEARLAELDAANLPADVDSILLDTAEIGTAGAGLTSIFTTAMTESYAADGVAPTPAQSLFLIQQALTEVAIVSTTETIKKLDGSTAAATLTLDDASSPTSKTRAT
jgi:hypothetical protein